MSQANKELVHRIIEEGWNRGNLEAIDELVAPGFVGRRPGSFPGEVKGPKDLKRFVTMIRRGLPDLRIMVEELAAEGDKVVARWSGRGTQTGQLPGIPATNRLIEWTGTSIYRISGGTLVESHENVDMLGWLQQLGVVPPLGY
jgi:steroid delta-isomerase-like uncharacterized protein